MSVQMGSREPQVLNFDLSAPGRVAPGAGAVGEGRLYVRQNCLRWDGAEGMLFWQACSYPAAGHVSVHALTIPHPHRHNGEMCFYLLDMLMQSTLDAIISTLGTKKDNNTTIKFNKCHVHFFFWLLQSIKYNVHRTIHLMNTKETSLHIHPH